MCRVREGSESGDEVVGEMSLQKGGVEEILSGGRTEREWRVGCKK